MVSSIRFKYQLFKYHVVNLELVDLMSISPLDPTKMENMMEGVSTNMLTYRTQIFFSSFL